MRNRIRRVLHGLVLTIIALGLVAAPAGAAGNTQISAVAVLDTGGACAESLLTSVVSGDLVGCWYTDTLQPVRETPSGVYQEIGTETFVGCLADGTTCGTFSTSYRFTAKFEGGVELFGGCEHPIVRGSGTGDFAGITGRVNWKDDVSTGLFYLEGHVALP